MALQAPTKPASPLAPPGNVVLRAPSDRFALKSAFFSPSLNLLLPSHYQIPTASIAPRYIYNERTPFEKVADLLSSK
ncbi:hypothetical protein DITRI_Ditri04bG0014200 [Diplodiscus trichospermus]